ncbi:MAG: hypothetical protein II627_05575, partial [Lachnospiraceae bacterium]|nr:hypothetical protein [Lachnospiraceae bacterium]
AATPPPPGTGALENVSSTKPTQLACTNFIVSTSVCYIAGIFNDRIELLRIPIHFSYAMCRIPGLIKGHLRKTADPR